MTDVDYSHLLNNFDDTEESEAELKGSVPSWITGTLLRNGPGMFEIGPDRYDHLFDGLAYMQRFKIHEGKVWYSAKFLRSETYETNMKSNRIVVSEFGTCGIPDPCKSLFKRYFSYYFSSKFTDNDCVNFVQSGDRVYASTETAVLNRIDVDTLDTLEQVDLHTCISVNTATAHPHYDREGNIYNVGSGYKDYCIIKTPVTGGASDDKDPLLNSTIVARFPFSHRFPSYYHSFGITENYVILPEMPLVINVLKILTAPIRKTPMSSSMEWRPDTYQTLIRVASLTTGKEVSLKYTTDPFFTFHHANAFETEVNDIIFLVVDCCAMEDGKSITNLSLEKLLSGWAKDGESTEEVKKSCLYRFVLPTEVPEDTEESSDLLEGCGFGEAKAIYKGDSTVHCTPARISPEESFEFPRINYDAENARPYTYLYCCGIGHEKGKLGFGKCITKMNVSEELGKTVHWNCEKPTQMACEPVFVASPDGSDPDDGVMLSPVIDMETGARDFLLMLDAKSMTELARAYLPARLPFSFHSHYVK